MSKFIFDELTGIPTILATNRAKRVDQTGAAGNKPEPSKDDKPQVCFFCRGNENLTPEAVYQDSDECYVRVFPNKFPLVDCHEIVVHSPDHDKDIPDFNHEQNVKIVRAFLNRTNYYTSQGKEVMIFNNRGGKAGASILHPHSQIVALPGFPGIIEMEKNKALRYVNEKNSCYWCDTVKDGLMQTNLVYESKHFALLVPEASRWSYEMILIPKNHRPNFEYMDEVEINDFARIMKSALYAYDVLFDRPDRNFWIHNQRYEPYHWHVGFIAHIKVMGGLELGAGIWVSDKAAPEDAAKTLSVHVKECYENETLSLV